MEKKQTNFIVPFKPAFIAAFVLFFYTVAGQKMQTFKDHCGIFYESMAHFYKIKKSELDFYRLNPDKQLQVLAPNAVIGKRPMLPLQIVSPFT